VEEEVEVVEASGLEKTNGCLPAVDPEMSVQHVRRDRP